MKRILLLLSLLFAVVSSPVGQEPGSGPGQPEWQRYTVKNEEFSVTLPMLPVMTTTNVTWKTDRKVHVEKQLRITFDEVDYTIVALSEPKQSLQQLIDEMGPTREYYDPAATRHLTINGFDVIEYSGAHKTSALMVQIVATEKHLYLFRATGPVTERRAMKEFFSSIKLGKDQDGVEVSEYTGERIYTGREVDVKARLLTRPEPSYTQDARKNGIEGTVVLKVIFAKDGQVTNIRTVAGLPYGITEQAIKAARKIKFTPAMKEGKPVSMWMQLEYNFTL
jgi:TonB family protein